MKYINITSKIAKVSTFALAIVLALGVSASNTAIAQSSTYIVDLNGNGCGNNCSDFYQYLAANGISVTSSTTNNTNSTTNNGSTSANTGNGNTVPNTSSASPYPYYTYTNFASTNSYYKATSSPILSVPQYPTTSYSYYQNPAAKYDSYLAGDYPDTHYIYYGKDATEQMAKYKKTYVPTSSTNTTNRPSASNGNLGFTITSVK